jgi:signal transduction histidine kinase
MESTRWWNVAVVGTSAVLATILLVDNPDGWPLAIGLASIGVFIGCWFGFGMRAEEDSAGSLALAVVVILFAGGVTIANPTLAIVQCLAFPLVWSITDSLTRALVYNVFVAVVVGVGLYVSTGADGDSLAQAVTIELLSLAFSIGIGLWITSIARRSHERQVLLDELQLTQADLAILSRDAGVTSERERLAREIHDTIAQDLTGIVMLAQRASRELAAGTLEPAHIEVLEENARIALAETRALVAASAPPSLGADGIAATITRLAERFERDSGIAVTVQTDAAVAVDRDSEVVLLRCAQEGLSNVRKHSGATAVALRLATTPDAAELTVTDNGSGFDTTADHDGYGLPGMRDRVSLVGGTLAVSSDGTGTTLNVYLPAKGSL